VGDAFPAAIVELTRGGTMEGDLSARSFTLVFSVPIAQANFSAGGGRGGGGVDLSVASRVADDQQVKNDHQKLECIVRIFLCACCVRASWKGKRTKKRSCE